MKEVWKDVVGYEGLYEVSNLGRVKSLVRKLGDGTGKGFSTKEKILKTSKSNNYKQAHLYNLNKFKSRLIHRMVATAFIPNPLNKPQVNHIDGVKSNNVASNLEWVTAKENQLHAIKTGLSKSRRGADCKLSKRVIQYDMNMNEIRVFGSIKEAGRELGVCTSSISRGCNFKSPSFKGFIWRYGV